MNFRSRSIRPFPSTPPKVALSLVVLAVALLVGASGLYAQGSQTGTLIGTVTTPDGASLPGVTVTVRSPNLMGERQGITAENGDYVIRGLVPGNYSVNFALPGMQ